MNIIHTIQNMLGNSNKLKMWIENNMTSQDI